MQFKTINLFTIAVPIDNTATMALISNRIRIDIN